MMSVLLPGLLVSLPFLALALAAVAARDGIVQPACPDQLEPHGVEEKAEDTLCGEELIKTGRPTLTEWKVQVFRTLAEVEDALDSLEARGVANREVHMLSESAFAVRWH